MLVNDSLFHRANGLSPLLVTTKNWPVVSTFNNRFFNLRIDETIPAVDGEEVEEAYSLVTLIFCFSLFCSVFEKLECFRTKNKKTNALSFTKKINVGKWVLKYIS